MEGQDLESAIERARGHDPEAFAEIYRCYFKRVFGLCRYILGSQVSAEDATSEVFLKLQRSIESYDASVPFLRWLLRVAANQCIDVLRRSRQRGREAIMAVEGRAAVTDAASPQPSPLNAVISEEESAQVRHAIAVLPENYRVPLVLRYYGELSYDEIAQQLGLQRNHVAALIFRAKQELRRTLAHRSK
jgi:RNA polymerase sigma-70 factor (ECF subfamily)